jgi:uncharacterized SAM-binding protein YcdF (DUF218 family)
MAFFPLSKIFWALVAPSHILLWLVLGTALALALKAQRLGRALAIAAALLFIAIGVLPTNLLLLRAIEYRPARAPWPARVDGILTLGGGLDDRIRLAGAYELARRYPGARVVYSGGSGALLGGRPGLDAESAGRVLLALGLDPHRLTLEGQSRNTWENILFTRRLVKPKPGETWVLATSALQLPRALEVAGRLQWKMLPWPTDTLSRQSGFVGILDVPGNLWAFDQAAREWIGLYAYRWSGMSRRA